MNNSDHLSLNRYVHTFGDSMREKYGENVYKISLSGNFTCPNRDGTLGRGGCTFCSVASFAGNNGTGTLREQLSENRNPRARIFLAYFQAYTNTYASIDHLRQLYEEALRVKDVVGIVIGTRPDCISDELLDYLEDLNRRTFLIVEYGVESANDDTLRRINRGHSFAQSRLAIEKTHQRGILTGAHIILGLPGEDAQENLRQAPLISSLPIDILKIHQMQIIRDTRLADEFEREPFHIYSVNEYIELIANYIQRLRKDLVLERFVSQSPKELLITPQWGLKNHEFTDLLNNYLKNHQIHQGDLLE